MHGVSRIYAMPQSVQFNFFGRLFLTVLSWIKMKYLLLTGYNPISYDFYFGKIYITMTAVSSQS